MLHEGLPPEERYYYKHLDPLARVLYLRIIENYLRLDFSYSYRGDEERYASFRAFEAIRWDYPELFPIQMTLAVGVTEENCEEYLRVAEDGTETIIERTYYTREEAEGLLAKLDAIYHSFDEITDPFELELAAYTYAIENFEYAYENRDFVDKEFDEFFTVAGLMRNGRGVCAAYTRFIQYILQRRGIPAVAICQNTERGNDDTAHAWLAVMIDGEYYHLDATFDEGNEKDPELFPYRNFNVTDEEIAGDRNFDPTR